jgi:hypothetical protein
MNRMKNKLNSLFLLSFVFLFIPVFVRAESPTRGALRQQIRNELIQEKKEEVKEKTLNVLERAKNIVKEKIKKQIKGDLVSIAGSILTVKKDQTTFTVNTTEKTELKRKFGANASLAEFSPNDKLLIIGNRVKNSDGTLSASEIDASYIRNMSIQRRFIVFTGVVEAKQDSIITLKTVGRGTQSVYTTTATKYLEKNKDISLSSIVVGDRIIVKGELWDRANDKIDAKSIMKLPVKPLSPTPTLAD